MEHRITFLLLVILAWCNADPNNSQCEESTCRLPNCRCASTAIPGGFSRENTPQFVIFAFDGKIDHVNVQIYRSLFYGAINANRCYSGANFYLNHEHTDYMYVSELYNMGFEIGLNSMTMGNDTYFKEADLETMMLEFADQRQQVAHFTRIPIESIQGMRMPNLQMNGDVSFQMMKQAGLRYDMSWPTIKYQDPGLWPYTLDYASIQDCIKPPCPTSSHPGLWEVPMIAWNDLDGKPCVSMDNCTNVPSDYFDEDSWVEFLTNNFNRHYEGNRAPFGFYIKESSYGNRNEPGFRRAVSRFIKMLNSLNDVFMVNVSDLIDWMENPVPLEEYFNKPCNRRSYAMCSNHYCSFLYAHHLGEETYLSCCNSCPRVYPWLGNPLGN